MSTLVFDLETNNLYPKVSRLHCMAITDLESGESFIFNNEMDTEGLPIQDGLEMLEQATIIIGHNIINYDLPVLKKLENWEPPASVQIRDTLVMSRLIHADIRDEDFTKKAKHGEAYELPARLYGSHSLKAWGYRIGKRKGVFKEENNFDNWCPEMETYCIQDTQVTAELFRSFSAKNYSEISIELEHEFAKIMTAQEIRGFCFDVSAANKLYGELSCEKYTLDSQLQEIFPPKEIQMKSTFWKAGEQLFETKTAAVAAGHKAKDVEKGPHKIKRIPFNSTSRDHIAERLQILGWKPTEFTENGKPKVDETILSKLEYPEAHMLSKILTLQKRMGQLADGNQGWLKSETKGRLHGHVVTNGAVTGRCTHRHPNMAQVPRDSEYRRLFKATDGMVLVGCDASGIELRCLAHYMNDADYTKKLLEEDIHTVNQHAAGLPSRDNAKTFIYGFLYGAGDAKIGEIIGKGAREGKAIKEKFLKSIPSLKVLKEKISSALSKRNYLKGLDGRELSIRSEHSALNTLLQSAGAVVMKKATVILYDKLVDLGLEPNEDFSFVAHVHDEFQIECWPEFADKIKEMAEASITEAGEAFNFRCPLDGEAKSGMTWADTH